ncbi:MAG TPA: UDP-N-acetylmuramoyl-L-alanine--D-glutamate ligase, partial [Planctomycetota bacterium]|nr:UDP-N-acetylmuramoyl-L-alanine--D-glutamate ligase [Planctomycetota bacterium]
ALRGVDVRFVLGGHDERDFTSAHTVVASPAVAPGHPLLAAARAAGARVTSETALFLGACPARVVLVTGTQGKSSTAHAAHALLAAAGVSAHLGGNIGRSLLGALATLDEDDVVVLELSSYQLESLPPAGELNPRTAAIGVVNVLADHLERHGNIASYEAAKRRILELVGDDSWVVLNGQDERLGRWDAPRGRVVRYGLGEGFELGLRAGRFVHGERALGAAGDVALPGDFQRSNVLCALGLALAAGAQPAALARALPGLTGLEHRLQDLGVHAGHRVVDNGVSTTPDSTLSAVLALEAPLCLLVGGQSKSLPLDELAARSKGRVRRVVAFGASAAELAAPFRATGLEALACARLEDAVALAYARMQPGEVLLFSPAAASFDAFRNFRDRALALRAALPPKG